MTSTEITTQIQEWKTRIDQLNVGLKKSKDKIYLEEIQKCLNKIWVLEDMLYKLAISKLPTRTMLFATEMPEGYYPGKRLPAYPHDFRLKNNIIKMITTDIHGITLPKQDDIDGLNPYTDENSEKWNEGFKCAMEIFYKVGENG